MVYGIGEYLSLCSETRSGQTARKALSELVETTAAKMVRGGMEQEIPLDESVVGDIDAPSRRAM